MATMCAKFLSQAWGVKKFVNNLARNRRSVGVLFSSGVSLPLNPGGLTNFVLVFNFVLRLVSKLRRLRHLARRNR